MPKVGMEPVRRKALVDAAIAEIGAVGSLDVTVTQIAKRAGMSSALAHHYFGSKENILLSAMREILSRFRQDVIRQLSSASGPRERLTAIVQASFGPENFQSHVIAAWLNFYVQAQRSKQAQRLLYVYSSRLHSNLVHELRQLTDAQTADHIACGVGALIDGLYIRQSLTDAVADGETAVDQVIAYLDARLPTTRILQ
jgi:TetR/AcrR family transcriptional repressor of bet genes